VKDKGSIIIGLSTAKFRQIIALLSMYQNASLIDDLEFEISKDKIVFCQTEDLAHLLVKAVIPLTFFDKFEISGDINSFVLPVRKIITSIDSMFSSYDNIIIKVKIEEDDSEIITLTCKREAYEIKSPENPRVIKEIAEESIEKFEKFKPLTNFGINPLELVDIGYNDNTTITLHILTKDTDTVFVTSESDLSGTKYAKKVAVTEKIQNEDLKFKYNLEYLKHVLINQKEDVSFCVFKGGLLKIVQHNPFNADYYISPLEDDAQ